MHSTVFFRLHRSIARFLLAVLTFGAGLQPLSGQGRLTLLTGFDQPPDPSAVEWMEQEVGGLFSDAGLAVSWQLRQERFEEIVGPLVSVQLRGKCILESGAIPLPMRGPMARVQSQDGEIRSFIQVDCDRTAAMVWQNRGTLPLPLVTRAFGRALGRVIAHELYHYLTQSAVHSTSELFSETMNSQDLTQPRIRFEASEIEALRKGMIETGSITLAAASRPATE